MVQYQHIFKDINSNSYGIERKQTGSWVPSSMAGYYSKWKVKVHFHKESCTFITMSIQPKSIFISIQSHLDKFNSIWKQSKIQTRVNLVNLSSSSTKTLIICYLSDILYIHLILNQSKRRSWNQQEMTIWIVWHCHLFSILLLLLSFKYHSIPIMRATLYKHIFLFNLVR